MQYLSRRLTSQNRNSGIRQRTFYGIVGALLGLTSPTRAARLPGADGPDDDPRRPQIPAQARPNPVPPTDSSGNPPDGWQPLTLEKTQQEKAADALQADDGNRIKNFASRLPSAYDSLRMQLGVGYVQGADWGFELGASGRMQGASVHLASLFTQGLHGLRMESGQLSVLDTALGRSLEAGDLQSDLWGTARGLRYGWHAGSGHQPSITLYLPGTRGSNPGTALSYREEVRLNSSLKVGSEIATDGSFLLKQRYQDHHLGLETYYRQTSNHLQDGLGGFLSYELGKGISVYGSLNTSDSQGITGNTQTLGFRIPLRAGANLTLECAEISAAKARNTLTSAMLITPLGPVRLLTRYQWTVSRLEPIFSQTLGLEHRYQDLMFTVGYARSALASFDYQTNIHWQQNGRPDSSTQLIGSLRLSNRTQLQLLSDFPDVLRADRLHLRWNQTLSRQMTASLDYGLLTPYQSTVGRQGNERGLFLMLRTHWDTPTAARGSEVQGRVLDPLGHGLKDAGVHLGSYQMLTDAQGRYRFRDVPAGTYALALVEDSLPTDYKADGTGTQLTVDGRGRRVVDLHAVPLRMIGGRVWSDKNGNGIYDPGEGMKNVVLHLGDAVTMTGDDGAFAFYNVEPGQYTLRVDKERLPEDYTVFASDQLGVDLPPDRSIANLAFRLKRKEKDIQFQPLP